MSITSLALLIGLGGRILLDQFTRSGEASAREFIVLGLWQGSGLHYVSTANKDLLIPAGALVAVKIFADFALGHSSPAMRFVVTLLGMGLGFCFADVLARWVEGENGSNPPARKSRKSHPRERERERDRERERERDRERERERDREEHQPTTKRRRSRSRSVHHRSEGDLEREKERERGSSRREPSRRAVSDITSINADSFMFEQNPTMTPLDREVAELRARASLADSERRRYKEERKWAIEQGNAERAREMAWQVKRYSALMKSFHREADDKIVEASSRRQTQTNSNDRVDPDRDTTYRGTDTPSSDRRRPIRVNVR